MVGYAGSRWDMLDHGGISWWNMLDHGGICWIMAGDAGSWWDIMVEYAGSWLDMLDYGERRWIMVGYAGSWWDMLDNGRIRWIMVGYYGAIYWITVGYTGSWWDTLACDACARARSLADSSETLHYLRKFAFAPFCILPLGSVVCSLFHACCHVACYHSVPLSCAPPLQIFREVKLHSALSHEHVVKLYGAFQEGDQVVLVQEYADCGDLLCLLHR